jgi:hypothetical protein
MQHDVNACVFTNMQGLAGVVGNITVQPRNAHLQGTHQGLAHVQVMTRDPLVQHPELRDAAGVQPSCLDPVHEVLTTTGGLMRVDQEVGVAGAAQLGDSL